MIRRALAAMLLAAPLALAGCAAIPRGARDAALERQLERAAEPAPGPRVFFLGVALSDRSPAFHGDVRILDRILRHRHGAAYRAVLLANREPVDEVRELPLATLENVDRAVQRLLELRRPDDRFIVLFTSHGVRGALAEQQRDAGIDRPLPSPFLRGWVGALAPNRTWVIISACYSGSLLEAVEGDQVLAMTASDAEHTSLGCGTLDRTTFLVGALARNLDFDRTLEEVWGATRQQLAAWEARYGVEGARPQLRVGAGLAGLERRPLSEF